MFSPSVRRMEIVYCEALSLVEQRNVARHSISHIISDSVVRGWRRFCFAIRVVVGIINHKAAETVLKYITLKKEDCEVPAQIWQQYNMS